MRTKPAKITARRPRRSASLPVLFALLFAVAACSEGTAALDFSNATCREYLSWSNDDRGRAVRTIGTELGWADAGNPLVVLSVDSHCSQRPDQTLTVAIGLFADNDERSDSQASEDPEPSSEQTATVGGDISEPGILVQLCYTDSIRLALVEPTSGAVLADRDFRHGRDARPALGCVTSSFAARQQFNTDFTRLALELPDQHVGFVDNSGGLVDLTERGKPNDDFATNTRDYSPRFDPTTGNLYAMTGIRLSVIDQTTGRSQEFDYDGFVGSGGEYLLGPAGVVLGGKPDNTVLPSPDGVYGVTDDGRDLVELSGDRSFDLQPESCRPLAWLDGTRFFCHGGRLVEVVGLEETSVSTLLPDSARTVQTIVPSSAGQDFAFLWRPDDQGMVLYSQDVDAGNAEPRRIADLSELFPDARGFTVLQWKGGTVAELGPTVSDLIAELDASAPKISDAPWAAYGQDLIDRGFAVAKHYSELTVTDCWAPLTTLDAAIEVAVVDCSGPHYGRVTQVESEVWPASGERPTDERIVDWARDWCRTSNGGAIIHVPSPEDWTGGFSAYVCSFAIHPRTTEELFFKIRNPNPRNRPEDEVFEDPSYVAYMIENGIGTQLPARDVPAASCTLVPVTNGGEDAVIVPCIYPHRWEWLGTVEAPVSPGPYPDDLSRLTHDACGETYPAPPNSNLFDIEAVYPYEAQWMGDGSEIFGCVAWTRLGNGYTPVPYGAGEDVEEALRDELFSFTKIIGVEEQSND